MSSRSQSGKIMYNSKLSLLYSAKSLLCLFLHSPTFNDLIQCLIASDVAWRNNIR